MNSHSCARLGLRSFSISLARALLSGIQDPSPIVARGIQGHGYASRAWVRAGRGQDWLSYTQLLSKWGRPHQVRLSLIFSPHLPTFLEAPWEKTPTQQDPPSMTNFRPNISHITRAHWIGLLLSPFYRRGSGGSESNRPSFMHCCPCGQLRF